jgi:hypothetical protein
MNIKLSEKQEELIRVFVIAPLTVNITRALRGAIANNLTERDEERIERNWRWYDDSFKEETERAITELKSILSQGV